MIFLNPLLFKNIAQEEVFVIFIAIVVCICHYHCAMSLSIVVCFVFVIVIVSIALVIAEPLLSALLLYCMNHIWRSYHITGCGISVHCLYNESNQVVVDLWGSSKPEYTADTLTTVFSRSQLLLLTLTKVTNTITKFTLRIN